MDKQPSGMKDGKDKMENTDRESGFYKLILICNYILCIYNTILRREKSRLMTLKDGGVHVYTCTCI